MKHHPEFSWLEQYAAATLPLPVALCVSTHLSFCSECRRQVSLLQNLGGLLFAQLEPMSVADELLQRILVRIDDHQSETAEVVAAPSVAQSMNSTAPGIESNVDDIPQPLRKLIGDKYNALAWSRLMPSLRAVDLPAGDNNYQVALHRVKPGGKIPRHDHRGQEFTVVLRGSFSDEYGIYGDGDFMLRQSGEEHLPLAALHEECICLTVQQAPARFTGLFWRWLNPLLS